MKRCRSFSTIDDDDDEDNESYCRCKKKLKSSTSSALVCLPSHLIAQITLFLTTYELFHCLCLTCKDLNKLVNSAMCWCNRMILLKDNEIKKVGHCKFMNLFQTCQFKSLGIWQEQSLSPQATSNASSRSYLCNLFSRWCPSGCGSSVNTEPFSSKTFESIINGGTNLQALALRTHLVQPTHIFQLLKKCPNLTSLRYMPQQTESTTASSLLSCFCNNYDIPNDQIQCKSLKIVTIVLDPNVTCTNVKSQLGQFVQIVLRTQTKLEKLELSSAQPFVTRDILKEPNNIAFMNLKELILKRQDVSDEALCHILSRTRKLEALLLEDIPTITAEALCSLPATLKTLMIFHCRYVGAFGCKVTIPSLPLLSKLAIKSKLQPIETCLQQGEYLLIRKLFAACNSDSLSEVILNNDGKYCLNGLWMCSDNIRTNLANLKTICLANTNLGGFALCVLMKLIQRPGLRLGISSDNTTNMPLLAKPALQALTKKCDDLVIRSHKLPTQWLEIVCDEQCVTKGLELLNCETELSDEFLPDCYNQCKSVERLSILGPRCGFCINDYGSIFSVFSNVQSLKLWELNPFNRWTLEVLSQNCPLLTNLSIRNCSHPYATDPSTFESDRIPMAEFKHLKKFEMIACSQPCEAELALMMYTMTHVEDFQLQIKYGSSLEVQYTIGGAMQLAVVNYCRSGFMAQLADRIRKAFAAHMKDCITLTKFWEWIIFTNVFRDLFIRIFEYDRTGTNRMPLLDPEAMNQTTTENLWYVLSDECMHLFASTESKERLAMLETDVRDQILHKCKLEDADGKPRKGMFLTVPIIFQQAFLPVVKRVMSNM
jgi:hypothetical protein